MLRLFCENGSSIYGSKSSSDWISVSISTNPGLGDGTPKVENIPTQLHQDFAIRKLIQTEAEKAGVSRIEVERFPWKSQSGRSYR